jgi:hypothetical protein
MKQHVMVLVAAFCGAAWCAPITSTEEFFQHEVKKGESISLICIDYYGRYTPEMAKAIMKENADVKDINVIFPGQALKLRNPSYKSETPAQAHPLFERTVHAVQGVVTCVEGSAQVTPKAAKQKQKLTVNTIVSPGDVIWTGPDGRVELIINRETVVRMRENTRMTVEAFRDSDKNAGKTRVGFSIGSVWTKMKKFRDKISRFELEMPTAIAGVHGTVYQATIDKDSSSEVKVFTGEVAVKNNPACRAGQSGSASEVAGPQEVGGPSEVSLEEWVSIVREMQKIRIDKKGKPRQVENFKSNETDAWETWNRERDRRVAELFLESE